MGNNAWGWIVAACLVTGALVWLYSALQERADLPGDQRRSSQRVLEKHARVLERYRQANAGLWPQDLDEFRRFSRDLGPELRLDLSSAGVRGAGIYRYRPPPGGIAPEAVAVMATAHPHVAVAQGQPLDSSGKQADRDLPAVFYVLTADLVVREVDDAGHARLAGWVRPPTRVSP